MQLRPRKRTGRGAAASNQGRRKIIKARTNQIQPINYLIVLIGIKRQR